MQPERFGLARVIVFLSSIANIIAVDSTPSLFLADEIKTLLEAHNDYRRQVVPQGSNIRFMTWDDDLAGHAQAYSNVCKFAHAPHYSFEPYGNIGENIYITTSNLRTSTNLKRVTTAWFNENRDYNFEENTCTPNRMCGHYTQVVWDNTYKIGCGITHCSGNVKVRKKMYTSPYIVVCKYGPGGNVRPLFSLKARKPYSEGKWCSKCPIDASVCIDKLCHDQNATEETTTKVHTSLSSTQTSVPKTTHKLTTQTTTTKRTTTLHIVPTLRCHVCDGESSADDCLFQKQTKTCGVHSKNSTAKISPSNPWKCISFWENDMIKMNCATEKTCEEMDKDEDRKVKCCSENYCNIGNGAKGNRSMSWSLTCFLLALLLAIE